MLDGVLGAGAAAWLADSCAAAGDRRALLRAFPAVGRRLGRGPQPAAGSGPGPAGSGELHVWTVDDAGRARLLRAAATATDPATLAALLDQLYVHGDAAERRGVLRALDLLPLAGEGLPLLRDALRTNDVRLVAAAIGGGYAARQLPDAEFDQAVLKCLFVGVPLAGIAALPARDSPRLARMVADFARERIAAGRDVPADAWLVLARYPDAVTDAGLPAEAASTVSARRSAAERFLASRPAPAAAPDGRASTGPGAARDPAATEEG
jgi:hypothetical protein